MPKEGAFLDQNRPKLASLYQRIGQRNFVTAEWNFLLIFEGLIRSIKAVKIQVPLCQALQLLFQLWLTEPIASLIQHLLSSIPTSTLEDLPGQMVVGFQPLQQRALDELIPQEAVHVPAQKLIGNFPFLQLVSHRIQQQLHHIDGCLRVLLSGL